MSNLLFAVLTFFFVAIPVAVVGLILVGRKSGGSDARRRRDEEIDRLRNLGI
ncbi:MAG: hypothetical protein ACOYLQ_01935 [Hyphomicrobiaceae bacterium]|jgi:hypothetical protein